MDLTLLLLYPSWYIHVLFNKVVNKSQKEIKGISRIVSLNEIVDNNYQLNINTYVNKQYEVFKNTIDNLDFIQLEDIANIRRSQLFRDEGVGVETYQLSSAYFNECGFTCESDGCKKMHIKENQLNLYQLKEFDILLTVKNDIGKVAIVGQTTKKLIASQAVQVIRLEGDNIKNRAIFLYMYLKSSLAQYFISNRLVTSSIIQLNTTALKTLPVPKLSDDKKEDIIRSFYQEIDMYNEINDIKSNIDIIRQQFLIKSYFFKINHSIVLMAIE